MCMGAIGMEGGERHIRLPRTTIHAGSPLRVVVTAVIQIAVVNVVLFVLLCSLVGQIATAVLSMCAVGYVWPCSGWSNIVLSVDTILYTATWSYYLSLYT